MRQLPWNMRTLRRWLSHLSTACLLNFSLTAWSMPFSLHLLSEPQSLDPADALTAPGSYLTQNIYRGLYIYRDDEGLVAEGAETCQWKSLRLTCRLKKNRYFSNGKVIVAADYVRAWRRLFDSKKPSLMTEQLLSLKNAKGILQGLKSSSDLGVRALDSHTLEIQFENKDPEFLYRLSSPSLAPWPAEQVRLSAENIANLITSGPYKIRSWDKKQKFHLDPNPFYPNSETRPSVEVYLIDDDSTALRLYDTKRLHFLRRLVTAEIPARIKSADFFQVPMARFDYIGFNPEKVPIRAREAFAMALDYDEITRLFFSKGRFGCPSLPRHLYAKKNCYPFDAKKARQLWQSLPEDLRNKSWSLAFSRQGGEDIARQLEWMQAQWQKHLGAKVELKPYEQTAFLNLLKNQTPDLFRKGVSADRPTCAGGLEVFSKDHPENYLQYDSPSFTRAFQELLNAESSREKLTKCDVLLQQLMQNFTFIPLGEMHFSLLARPRFKGWNLNSLNQLDLTRLVQTSD